MEQELKQKWVAALRSGEYKQAKEVLRKNGKHCCLGVLCELLSRDSVGTWRGNTFEYDDASDSFELPHTLHPKIGIDVSIESDLIYMNDSEDKTFPEIADWIEANL